MLIRQGVRLGSIVWAVVGLAVGMRSIGAVNSDARALVLAACVVGSASALMASAAVARRRDRLAGALLVVSVITPTFFAWMLNVPALLVGAVLLFGPTMPTRRAPWGRNRPFAIDGTTRSSPPASPVPVHGERHPRRLAEIGGRWIRARFRCRHVRWPVLVSTGRGLWFVPIGGSRQRAQRGCRCRPFLLRHSGCGRPRRPCGR